MRRMWETCDRGWIQADLEDHANELKASEENAKRAMSDAARLAEELRHEQEHSQQIEKLRRALEQQLKELQVFKPTMSLLTLPQTGHWVVDFSE